MSKEASIFEYTEIIIPAHESTLVETLNRIPFYGEGTKERRALILAAKLNELHIQYLKLRIKELQGDADSVRGQIAMNKAQELAVQTEFDDLGIDVRDLLVRK